MSLIWFSVWVGLSVFILGIFVWTTRALSQQKAAWKAFATRRNLSFRENKFLQAAQVFGKLDGIDFILTSEERMSDDMRGRRFVTLVQFGLPVTMPAPAAVGSGDYKEFLQMLQAKHILSLEYPGWTSETVLAVSDDTAKLGNYFTPERLKVLDTLIRQKNVSVLFLFDENNAFVRLETVDPLMRDHQLDKLVDKILPLLRVLYPTQEGGAEAPPLSNLS